MFSSDDEDFGDDIDDVELIALATQAEQNQEGKGQGQEQPDFVPQTPPLFPGDNNVIDDDIEDLSDDFTPAITGRRPPQPPPQRQIVQTQPQQQQQQQRLQSFRKGPPVADGLRQSTLLGGRVNDEENAATHGGAIARRNWPLSGSQSQEKPTHHQIDREAAKTWVYPINVSFRDYQFNIVKRALFCNLLCALPTGLGKTFIAATVMLNWYRWVPNGQIAFLAPTKPLVNQQIDACFNIAGIPKSQTAVMTGGVPKATRRDYWGERRVFFTTPQTMQNDIKNGICDPKRVVCLVVDEAHRATGSYAYVEVVKLVRRENTSFRLLALTATPGSTVEAVQGVIDALGIARVEIRTDESLDIRDYIQKRTVEIETFELPPEIVEVRDLYCKCLEPLMKKLHTAKASYQTSTERLTPFGVRNAMQSWLTTPPAIQASLNNRGYYWSIRNAFTNLSSLAHPLVLLNTHGLRLFHQKMLHAPAEDEDGVAASSKALATIKSNADFGTMMARCAEVVGDTQFSGHPKMDHMLGAILNHFAEAEDEDTKRSTRIMVFTSFRDSAEEITKFLRRHEPMVRPHVFVGQAGSKGSAGMSQKEQLEIVSKFQDGTYNTIVSTSVGEEGLDIGEVDLIVCYDMQASPIRLLQRMGRTGRKRNGGVLILVTEGREADSYKKALDNYQYMQKKIATGNDFTLQHDMSPRIIPKEIECVPDKKFIDPPPENSQPEPAKKAKAKRKAAPIKKFFMPEGVETGFTKASRVGTTSGRSKSFTEPEPEPEENEDVLEEEILLAVLGDRKDVLLKPEDEQDLRRRFASLIDDEDWVIDYPSLETFPEVQRYPTEIYLVPHGKVTKSYVQMVQRMYAVTEEKIEHWKKIFNPELLKSPKKPKTKPFKPVRPAKNGMFSSPVVSSPLIRNSGNTTSGDSNGERTPKSGPKRKTPTTKRKQSPNRIVLSSDSEDKLVKEAQKTTPAKKRKAALDPEDEDQIMSDESDLPDAKDLLSGFRWAGSLKKR